MDLVLHNSLTRKTEVFTPIDKSLVRMYVCGPTVYDDPHIGNARSAVVYDLLYRILINLYGKSCVKYVRNITDVDDKIINRAGELNITISELTAQTTKRFHDDMDHLGCLAPTIEPKATQHINDMVNIIQKLLDTNHAYIADGHVYFNITTAFGYTQLSGQNLDEVIEGARVDVADSKKHPGDFVLWKPAGNDHSLAEANFDSPWGMGRPGWHIECSAMSYRYLGEDFDIHGGGADLIFPHHTNEIAQSIGAFPNSTFAKYWVHNGFLTCNGDKMSKSLGNFITVKNLIDKKIAGSVMRLFLLTSHYRKPLDFNEKALEDAAKIIYYWSQALEDVIIDKIPEPPNEFLASLFTDMNTPLAIKITNDYAKMVYKTDIQSEKKLYSSYLLACMDFLGIKKASLHETGTEEEKLINEMINKRARAKAEKNWDLADKIRAELADMGVILEDATGKTIWRKEHKLKEN